MSRATNYQPTTVLTLREKQVLIDVAVGLSAKEVAKDLAIAPRTVERHIENIRLKMHARNTPHLITLAFAIGALSPALVIGALRSAARGYSAKNDA